MASALPKRDDNVRIPAAVRAQAARANALVEGNNPEAQAAAAAAEAEAAAQAQTQDAQDGQPALTATPVAEPPAEPAQTPSEPRRERTQQEWEHAFNSVNERYRSQVRVNNELQAQIAALTQQVTQLQNARSPDLNAAKLVTPEEAEQWGGELLDVVGKRAKEALLPEIEALRNEVASMKGSVESTNTRVAMTAREQMFADMDRQLPQWRALNNDPKFIQWLDLPDGLSDAIRQGLLDEAVSRNDAAKALRIFKGFLAEEAATAPRQQPAPAPAQVDPLTKFAAPGRARTAAANNAPAEKPTFTAQEISQFYVQVRQGKYRNNEAEKNRIEQAIFDAQRDGRVIP